MADISVIKTPDGTSYNIKDTTARANSGVTGVKGNSESSYRTGNVNLTAANVGAVNKSGDTMTGQLKTSFKSSVAMGSYSATAVTITSLCEELRYSSGCCGSANITTAYSWNNITIPVGWYNFLWIPHRNGGINGSENGDNCNYGALYLSAMGSREEAFLIHYSTGAIRLVSSILDRIPDRYINIHPENTPILIPFMHNDIAHLLNRGGSAVITYDGTAQSTDISAMFDGSGSYQIINPTGITTIVIELTLHKIFTYSNTVYVDFGYAWWRAKSVIIEVWDIGTSAWVSVLNTSSNSVGHVTASTSRGSTGFNKVRFTFSDWSSSVSFRIAQLGIYNYGSLGLRETYMSRGVDDQLFRSLTPYANSTYNIGSSSKYWRNGYFTNINGVAVGSSPKFTDTTALTSMTGTLPVANGGTGQTTAVNAANTFANALTTGSSDPTDADYYISQYAGGGTSTTTYHRRPHSALWNYIKGKISSVLGLTATNYGGTSAKATADASGNTITTYYAPKSTAVTNVALSTNKITKTINGTTTDVVTAATTSAYGITKLNTATNSMSTTEAATPSAVKTAYDLANTANTTANTALSGVNGSLIYDHTYTISNGVATFTAHVYCKGAEVTSSYADSCFSWSYKLASSVTGTPSVVSLGTGKTKTVTISTLGYGGYILGTFTPPS